MERHLGLVTRVMMLLAMLSLLVAAGDWSASAYQGAQVDQINTTVDHGHAAFLAQLSQSVVDGTPAELLTTVTAAEFKVYQASPGRRAYFVDRLWLDQLRHRAQQIDGYRREAVAIQTQVEVDLNHQISAALQRIQAGLDPARAAGLDITAYQQYVATTQPALDRLQVPKMGTAMASAAKDKAEALARATTDQLAANQALTDAKTTAANLLGRAQGDLAQAQAIPVLDVRSDAANVAALAARVATAATLDDFHAVSADLDNQASSLENLVFTRNDAFQILSEARSSLGAARAAKVNVDADSQGLDAAAAALAQAPNLDAIVAARNRIRSIKNDLDFQAQQAQLIAAAGKLILISLHDQHLRAVQDGVVLMETDIATGRPALPTPVGVTHIMAKYSPYEMVSPWGPGSPYYYNPSWVQYAMLFHDGGYFIHDAPWRTVWGPGANLTVGTHGCVNVPLAGEVWLWNWAPVGTTVSVVP